MANLISSVFGIMSRDGWRWIESLWVAKTSAETQEGAVLGGVGRRLSVRYGKKTLEGANPRARGAHIYKAASSVVEKVGEGNRP